MRRWWPALVALAAGVWWLAGQLRDGAPAVPRAGAAREITEFLSGDDTGFARVLAPRALVFPADHGPHPGYRHEWWYLTGHLAGSSGETFGVQLTFFRFALSPGERNGSSAWATNQVYMAHFALSDPVRRTFVAGERMARAALGLAGAQAEPFRVWVYRWSMASTGDGFFPLRLRAMQDEVELDLLVDAGKPMVLNGTDGYSRKGAGPGNASIYFSWPRLPATGRVTIQGESREVRGELWMDREWGSSALGPDIAGWDWFALQFEDGSEFMFYRLRRTDGSTDHHSAGTRIDADGTARPVAASAVRIETLGHWQGSGGIRYPSGWRIWLLPESLELTVEPLQVNQELDLTVRYWEGAVRVSGRSAQGTVPGTGFVELAGYGTTR